MEKKGLKVNIPKTVFMISGTGLDVLKDSGRYPCSVCRKGVGANSIYCTGCAHWVHKKCSGIRGRLMADPNYICPRCLGCARPVDRRPATEVTVDDSQMKVVSEFCYLGDMLSSGGGCTQAIIARCRVAWGKFKKLLPDRIMYLRIVIGKQVYTFFAAYAPQQGLRLKRIIFMTSCCAL